MKMKSMVVPWLSLNCLLMGMLLSFDSAFECGIQTEKHILPIFMIAGMVLFLVLYLRTNYAVIFTLSAVAGMGIFALTKIETLQQDFLSVIYYINKKSIAYNNKVFTPFEGIQGDLDQNLLLFIMGVLFAVFIAFFVFRMHNCWYGMLPVYFVVGIGMAVGRTPDKAAVAFLAAGIALTMAWVSRQDHGGGHFFVYRKTRRQRSLWAYAVLGVVLLTGGIAAWQYGRWTEDYVLKDAREYLRRQHEMERQAKRSVGEMVQFIRKKMGNDSDGMLSNAEPKYKDETVIKITVSQKPKGVLYLRGFVGGEYKNGTWKECDTASFRAIMPEEGDAEAVFDVGFEFGKDNLKRKGTWGKGSKMKMEHVGEGKKSKFAYLPYFFSSVSVSNDTSKKCITFDGENGICKNQDEYSVKYYNMEQILFASRSELAEDQYGSAYRNAGVEKRGLNTLEEKSASWKLPKDKLAQYYDYVEKSYARLPETGLDRLKELAEASVSHDDDIGLFYRTSEIRSILEQRAVYDKKLDPVPLGQDYVEYFLLEQQRGFCEHFATAGVLLLRACQVPARYASGYKVEPERFERNKNNTYTAKVLDSDAHAWAEVFNEYYGWYPAEMTPGESVRSQSENNNLQSEQDVSSSAQQEEEKEKTKEEATKAPLPKKQPQGGMKQALWGSSPFLMIFLAVLLVALIPASYVVYQRHIQNKYREELQKRKEDRNAAIRIRSEWFLYFLKKCGKRRLLQKNEAEWFAFLAQEYPEVKEETWLRLKEVLQEAEFSNESVSTEKYDFFFDTAAKTERLIFSRSHWVKRSFLRIIGCLK